MNNIRTRVAIITNVIPSYRLDFYRRLLSSDEMRISIFCQSHIPGMNLATVDGQLDTVVITVPFVSLAREKLSWQFLPLRRLWRDYDVYFVYGNPRVLSNVVFASLFKLLGKKVVIWGQAHTAGANRLSEALRLAWWRLFDYLFVYTDREAENLRRNGFASKTVIGMNNGLDQDEIDRAISLWSDSRLAEWRTQQALEGRKIVLSCARLEAKNRFEWFLEGLPELVNVHPEMLWCVIGTSILFESLRQRANELGVSDHVRWLGAIYGQEQLAPWFMSSQAMVHPGAIGLSLLHAFGYGLPVVTHDKLDKHMPEIAAFSDRRNGLLYRHGDANSLQAAVARLLEDDQLRVSLSANARQTAAREYNTRVMADRFISMVRACVGGTDKAEERK